MRLESTRRFHRDFLGLPEATRNLVQKQLALLLHDPRHPSLRLKKMRGTQTIWEIRVTRGYRLTLNITSDAYILRRVGTHDTLRQP